APPLVSRALGRVSRIGHRHHDQRAGLRQQAVRLVTRLASEVAHLAVMTLTQPVVEGSTCRLEGLHRTEADPRKAEPERGVADRIAQRARAGFGQRRRAAARMMTSYSEVRREGLP